MCIIYIEEKWEERRNRKCEEVEEDEVLARNLDLMNAKN